MIMMSSYNKLIAECERTNALYVQTPFTRDGVWVCVGGTVIGGDEGKTYVFDHDGRLLGTC